MGWGSLRRDALKRGEVVERLLTICKVHLALREGQGGTPAAGVSGRGQAGYCRAGPTEP